jgi:hypothetical protein
MTDPSVGPPGDSDRSVGQVGDAARARPGDEGRGRAEDDVLSSRTAPRTSESARRERPHGMIPRSRRRTKLERGSNRHRRRPRRRPPPRRPPPRRPPQRHQHHHDPRGRTTHGAGADDRHPPGGRGPLPATGTPAEQQALIGAALVLAGVAFGVAAGRMAGRRLQQALTAPSAGRQRVGTHHLLIVVLSGRHGSRRRPSVTELLSIPEVPMPSTVSVNPVSRRTRAGPRSAQSRSPGPPSGRCEPSPTPSG